MKKRKTRISGEVTSVHQKYAPVTGPRCQRADIACPVAASTPMPAAKATQKPTAIPSSFSRGGTPPAPPTMITNASASHGDIGPHQKSSGSAIVLGSTKKQRTSPKFDGL